MRREWRKIAVVVVVEVGAVTGVLEVGIAVIELVVAALNVVTNVLVAKEATSVTTFVIIVVVLVIVVVVVLDGAATAVLGVAECATGTTVVIEAGIVETSTVVGSALTVLSATLAVLGVVVVMS
jgi:hypothetical protein